MLCEKKIVEAIVGLPIDKGPAVNPTCPADDDNAPGGQKR